MAVGRERPGRTAILVDTLSPLLDGERVEFLGDLTHAEQDRLFESREVLSGRWCWVRTLCHPRTWVLRSRLIWE